MSDRKYTTLSVSFDTYKHLKERAPWGESMNDFIRSLLKLKKAVPNHDKNNKKSVSKPGRRKDDSTHQQLGYEPDADVSEKS